MFVFVGALHGVLTGDIGLVSVCLFLASGAGAVPMDIPPMCPAVNVVGESADSFGTTRWLARKFGFHCGKLLA